jgi:methyltransferase (TIGR00027 family)
MMIGAHGVRARPIVRGTKHARQTIISQPESRPLLLFDPSQPDPSRAERTSSRSLVAGVNAMFRARERERSIHDRIVDDPFAAAFEERDPRVMLVRSARYLQPKLRRMIEELQTAHCLRHRAIDELLIEAIEKENIRQILILGAGYDSRSRRLLPKDATLRFVEIDQAPVLNRKNERSEPDPRLERRALDLANGSIAKTVATTRLDPTQPTCIVLEGLIHYLSEATASALFAELRALLAEPQILLTFIRSEIYATAPSRFVQLVRLVNEIPRLHFTHASLEAFVRAHGFEPRGIWTRDQQIERFAPAAARRLIGLAQDVARLGGTHATIET